MDILRGSALYAPTFDKKRDRMVNGDFSMPNFPVRHLLKDVNLIVEEYRTTGIHCEPLAGVIEILKQALDLGLGDLDYSALFTAVSSADTHHPHG